MARNEEKHFGKLNRIILGKLREEELKRNPKRPNLETLSTAKDIRMWLPSITKELEFNLAQSQVGCYPDRVIEGFHQKIDHLKQEYQAFVRKLRSLDPDVTVIPWTERAYDKRKLSDDPSESDSILQKKSKTVQSKINPSNEPEERDSSKTRNDKPGLVTSSTLTQSESENKTQPQLAFERLSLPILNSNTEDLYKKDKEKGLLNAEQDSDSKLQDNSTTNKVRQVGSSSSDAAKGCSDLKNDSCETKSRLSPTFSTTDTDHNFSDSLHSPKAEIKLESEYGFHNDKPLVFSAQRKCHADAAQQIHTNTVQVFMGDLVSKTLSKTSGEHLPQDVTSLAGIMQYGSSDDD